MKDISKIDPKHNIIIKGANIMESTAITKLLNLSSNFAAFIIFAIQGYVIWYLGLIMAVAQIAGAYTGSRFAIKCPLCL